MKGFPILAAMGLIVAMASSAKAADETNAHVTTSRELVKAFAISLKAELQQAMQDGGSIKAISVCQTAAPGIAAQQSLESSWDVGRTARRLRNPENAPDAWEQDVLKQFEVRKAGGEDVQMLEHHETVSENGQRYFRYMKAIPTAELCTTCHGADLAADVEARLAELYPDDQAIGFETGDIRGAFTLKKPLN